MDCRPLSLVPPHIQSKSLLPDEKMQKYCFIQVDLDDNQWVHPRQRGHRYDIFKCDTFVKAVENMEKYLAPYPFTLFVVGMDMKVERKVHRVERLLNNCPIIEIANHTLSHFNNFSTLSRPKKEKEILDSDRAIREALGLKHIYGFRSPGYVFTNDTVEILKENAYRYDSSLLPSYFGPVLRGLNYLINKVPGKNNFGHIRNGLMSNEPVLLDKKKMFFEINVSVCPILRCPIHYSVIKSRKIYNILFCLIKKLRYLNFLFHLYDFVNVDTVKLRYVLNLITFQRELVLSKDIDAIYIDKQ